MTTSPITTIKSLWEKLYKNQHDDLLSQFIKTLDITKKEHFTIQTIDNPLWFRECVVYSLYVDLFNGNFEGLKEKLHHIKALGINCLWLLPILDSPMKDAGYDIRDYISVRSDLFLEEQDLSKEKRLEKFKDFIDYAHHHGIHIIFDLVLNHCSNEHEFFQSACESKESPYRDYFIWNDNDKKYKKARIIFKGLMESNWEYSEKTGQYYLHRFYETQPDWNYSNPKVLLYIIDILIFWKKLGIDGFRLDAIPYLWKEEGTNCESLENCHTIIKLLRAVVDYLEKGTLFLAEACQPIEDLMKYFGDGDECHSAYHFPLMQNIYASLATENTAYIHNVFQITPETPKDTSFFLFLRGHDELTLEMTTKAFQDLMNQYYCLEKLWEFREGEGISARLYELFEKNPERVLLAYSILFTLPGVPIIYYGDEIAMENSMDFYEEMYKVSGYYDSRNLCRARINWDEAEKRLQDSKSAGYQIYYGIQKFLQLRKSYKSLYCGTIEFTHMDPSILSYRKIFEDEEFLIMHNLKNTPVTLDITGEDILGNYRNGILEGYKSLWIKC